MPDAYEFTPTANDPMRGAFAGRVYEYPPASSAPDPTLANVTPTGGAPIGRRSALGFDVLNNPSSVFLKATFAGLDLASEVVYDPDGFSPLYAGSTVEEISGGFRFSIVRVGGWPAGRSPILRGRAVRADGVTVIL
jgi:hypothetical protein